MTTAPFTAEPSRRRLLAAGGAAVFANIEDTVAAVAERDPMTTAKAALVSNGPLDARQFGAKGDGITDDRGAIQNAIDYAIANGMRRLEIGPGKFLINGTLEIKGSSRGLELRGANGSFIGNTELIHHSSQKTNPLLNIQNAYAVRLINIQFTGNNIAPADPAVSDRYYNAADVVEWVSSGVQNVRYAPYCGIAVDALSGADPGAGNNYTFGAYGQLYSTKLSVERCRVNGFVVAIAVKPCDNDSGTEDIKISDCQLQENAYAVITTGGQQRNVTVENTGINRAWCAFDNFTFGRQVGQPINVRHCIFDHVYRAFQISQDIGTSDIQGCYFESVSTLGIIGRAPSISKMPATFTSCHFSLTGVSESASGVYKDEPLKVYMPTIFSGCAFVSQFQFLVYAQEWLIFDNCVFRCESRDATTNPGDQEIFGVHCQYGGMEYRLKMRGCSQRVYSGTAKYLDNDVALNDLPTRGYIMPHTGRIRTFINRTEYKLTLPNEPRTANISNITYVDANTLTFTETTTDKILLPGDVLWWRAILPTRPDDPVETSMLPCLQVTSAVGGTITCKMLANVDTTYAPTSVDVRIRLFVNKTVSTGDTTASSADIANVTNVANLKIGDWIQFSNGALVSPAKIVNIVGTTVTVHRKLNVTAVGVTICNTLLSAV